MADIPASAVRAVDVLVTGAAGFLGSHLTRRLVAEGARVHAFVRKQHAVERLSDVMPFLHLREGDLCDQVDVERCLDETRPRIVFHAAGFTGGRDWSDPAAPALLAQSYDVNVMGTLRLLAAMCERVPDTRLIRLGGLEEYGSGSLPYREPQREAPTSAYSASQVAATHLGEMFHRRFGLPVVTLRPALVYGPQQSTTFLIPALITTCLTNGRFEVTAGNRTRDFVYVDDVVDACMRSAAAPGIEGQVINVGSGEEYRIRDIAQLVVRLTGGCPDIRVRDDASHPHGLERLVCDPSCASELLGWRARTTIEAGLTATIADYRRRSVTPSAGPM